MLCSKNTKSSDGVDNPAGVVDPRTVAFPQSRPVATVTTSAFEPKSDSVSVVLGASDTRSRPRPPSGKQPHLAIVRRDDAGGAASPDQVFSGAGEAAAEPGRARNAVANIHRWTPQDDDDGAGAGESQ
jgi:hypothetical protein